MLLKNKIKAIQQQKEQKQVNIPKKAKIENKGVKMQNKRLYNKYKILVNAKRNLKKEVE